MLQAGELAMMLSSGANHDPQIFKDPHDFRPGRENACTSAMNCHSDVWQCFLKLFLNLRLRDFSPGTMHLDKNLSSELGPKEKMSHFTILVFNVITLRNGATSNLALP